VVAVGGLAKGDDDGLQELVDRMVADLRARFATDPGADDPPTDDPPDARHDEELDSRLDARG
jgi:cytochrome c biogenesis protein